MRGASAAFTDGIYDIAVVGGGPAGSACAITAARLGCRVILIERARFPREKVCGDCLNPAAASTLDNLGLYQSIVGGKLPARQPEAVEFVSTSGRTARVQLPEGREGEWVISRRELDEALHQKAHEQRVTIAQETAVTSLSPGWEIETTRGLVRANHLVAADGRNSRVARLRGDLSSARPRRVGLRTILPEAATTPEVVTLRIYSSGYGGTAVRADGTTNLCLVAPPNKLDALKAEASEQLQIPEGARWETIAPLERKRIPSFSNGVLYIGDAARVVEPLTGEGISYALRTGELAGRVLANAESVIPEIAHQFSRDVDALYQKTIRLNHFVRFLVERPPLADGMIRLLDALPPLARYLTGIVVPSAPDLRPRNPADT